MGFLRFLTRYLFWKSATKAFKIIIIVIMLEKIFLIEINNLYKRLSKKGIGFSSVFIRIIFFVILFSTYTNV